MKTIKLMDAMVAVFIHEVDTTELKRYSLYIVSRKTNSVILDTRGLVSRQDLLFTLITAFFNADFIYSWQIRNCVAEYITSVISQQINWGDRDSNTRTLAINRPDDYLEEYSIAEYEAKFRIIINIKNSNSSINIGCVYDLEKPIKGDGKYRIGSVEITRERVPHSKLSDKVELDDGLPSLFETMKSTEPCYKYLSTLRNVNSKLV